MTQWGRRLNKYANAADNDLSNDDIDDHQMTIMMIMMTFDKKCWRNASDN